MEPKPPQGRAPVFGTLSLIVLGAAVSVGAFSTLEIAARTEGMASFEAVAGTGFGFLSSVPSPLLAAIGLLRDEKPRWPAPAGLVLGLLPTLIGLWMLWELLLDYYAHAGQ